MFYLHLTQIDNSESDPEKNKESEDTNGTKSEKKIKTDPDDKLV
jgi:hypothetical protein